MQVFEEKEGWIVVPDSIKVENINISILTILQITNFQRENFTDKIIKGN